MRRLLLPIAIMAILTLFAACEQDFYEKGDRENSYLRADFVEAVVGSNKQVQYVVTDENVQMLLSKAYTANWIQRADTVYRAVMYYSQRENAAEVRSLSRVTTIPLTRDTTTNGSTWTSDPVGFEAAWISTSRKYLNLGLILKMGATEKSARPQSIGMLLNRVDTAAKGQLTGHLQLIHKQGDVPEYYSQRVYISLPLQELTVDTLYLTIDTYDGVVRKGFLLSKD